MRRALILLLTIAAYAPAAAQDDPITHSTYLEQTGMLDSAAELEQWLRDELAARHPDWAVDRRHQNAAFFAFVLTVTGVTAEAAAALQEQGVDVIHGLTADTRPFLEQALFADVVVVGEVVRSEVSDAPGDGFESSDVVAVRRVLKGEAGREITIRRRDRERDIVPVVGSRYLLLLSNGMYNFAAARHRGTVSEPVDDHFSVYRIYEMDDDRLLWMGFDRDQTASALEEIQLLDELLSGR